MQVCIGVLALASVRACGSPANVASVFLKVSALPDAIARPAGWTRARPDNLPRPDVISVELVAEILSKW